MNAKIVISAIALFVVCQVVVNAEEECFDMEKYHKDSAEMVEKKKVMMNGLHSMCKNADKKEEVKCVKEKSLSFMTPDQIKKEAKKYFKNQSKVAPFESMVDECFKDKPKFFECYIENVVKICPEAKEVIDTVKKEYPEFFE